MSKKPVEFRAYYRLVRELGAPFDERHFKHVAYATLDMIMSALRTGRERHGALSADHVGLALACVKSARMRVELLKSILTALGPHQAWPPAHDLARRMPDYAAELALVLARRATLAATPALPAPEPALALVLARRAPEPARRALKRARESEREAEREAERLRERSFVASDSAESMQGESSSSSSSSYAPSSSSDSDDISESARRRHKRVCRESELLARIAALEDAVRRASR